MLLVTRLFVYEIVQANTKYNTPQLPTIGHLSGQSTEIQRIGGLHSEIASNVKLLPMA